MSNVNEAFADAIAEGLFSVVQQQLVRDPDVTDDILAREATLFVERYLPLDSPTGRAMQAVLTPPEIMKMTSRISAQIRRASTLAVAAALDEDPGATESSVSQFLEMYMRQHVPITRNMDSGLAVILARFYSARCRRSGMHPEAWANEMERYISTNYWAFRRA